MSKNWAICIGINDYYNLKPLQYAVQDAAAVRDFFVNDVNFEQVFYFADDSPAILTPRGEMRSAPTYANLKRFFRERFQQPFLSMGDNFWFFFAGHGELHEGHDYLMPMDVDPGNIEETALRISDITASLRNSGADNTVLLLDACRSQGRRSTVGFGGEEAQKGMVTIYSCSPRESSYEIDELAHGAFTHALLEGFQLQGANSCATVERLDQYLRHQVPSLNQRYQKPPQTPYTAVEPLSKNCLILLPQRATLQDVQALKNEAFRAEAANNLDFSQQLWVRVLAASMVDQDAIAAFGRLALKRAQSSPSTPDAVPGVEGSRSSENLAPPPPPPTKVIPTFDFDLVTITKIEKGGLFGAGAPRVITHSRKAKAEYRREELGQGVTLDLMLIPGGSFLMGSAAGQGDNDERPQHKVTVNPFLMGKYPVTQAQWKAVAALPKVERDLDADPAKFKGDNRPVECIDWDAAVEFCQRLSKQTGHQYRLPSEAEWEYACRAGTTTPFHFGETITTDLANYRGTDWEYKGKTYPGYYGQGLRGEYREQTTDVGSFAANAFGLYDMHGNVWEWCLDHWHENYEGAPTDNSAWIVGGDSSKRLLRGGSWLGNPAYCRSAFRFRNARASGSSMLVFELFAFPRGLFSNPLLSCSFALCS